MISNLKWKMFNDSLVKEDFLCINCKYKFDENICVNHDSPVGYGGKVSDDFSCGNWEADLYFFDGRLKEIGM